MCAKSGLCSVPAKKAANEGGREGSGSGNLWCCESDFRLAVSTPATTIRCVSVSVLVMELNDGALVKPPPLAKRPTLPTLRPQ